MPNIARTLGWIIVLKYMYLFCFALAIISAICVPLPLITAFILIIPPLILTWMIPLCIGTQQGTYREMFYLFGGTIIFSIVLYACLYYKNGIYIFGSLSDISFLDALYFSITTWTTLGYGDFAPSQNCRLVTSFEALTGYLSWLLKNIQQNPDNPFKYLPWKYQPG